MRFGGTVEGVCAYRLYKRSGPAAVTSLTGLRTSLTKPSGFHHFVFLGATNKHICTREYSKV